jgi:beta-lactamase superfamily II metal-dependent hydrolase
LSGVGNLAKLVRSVGGATRVLREGDKVIPECGVDSLVLLAPPARQVGPAGELGENDSSLVFRLGPPGMDVLFTGDLEFAGEEVLLDRGLDPTARILKVGHHGSRGSTSLEFLAAVRPRYSVIIGWPTGPRAGPSDQLLERFIQLKSMVVATSLVGDVTVEIGKNRSEKKPLSPVFKARTRIPQDFSGVNGLFKDTNKKVKKPSGAR